MRHRSEDESDDVVVADLLARVEGVPRLIVDALMVALTVADPGSPPAGWSGPARLWERGFAAGAAARHDAVIRTLRRDHAGLAVLASLDPLTAPSPPARWRTMPRSWDEAWSYGATACRAAVVAVLGFDPVSEPSRRSLLLSDPASGRS